MTDAGPSLSRFTAPWQLEIVPTSTAAAAPLSPAARTIASPSSTASTANVPTPNTWWRHTNSAGPNTGSPAARSDGATRPPLPRARQDPFEHEVWHEGGRDDVVLRLAKPRPLGATQEPREVDAPIGRDEAAVGRLAQLGARPARGIAVDDDHATKARFPLLLRSGQLTRVEHPVAAAADDDHVPHDDRVAHRIGRRARSTARHPRPRGGSRP